MATPTRLLSPILIAWMLSAWASSASAQVGSPTSYASLGTLNPGAGTYALDTTAQTLTIGSTVYRGVVQAQPNGPNVIVFAFSNVTIGNGVTINATGSQPFALLSQSNMTFNGTGTVNLSAPPSTSSSASTAGAGGGGISATGGAGSGPGAGGTAPTASNFYFGGGGGGFGGVGGNGGGSRQGPGGSTYPSSGDALLGGSGGGGTGEATVLGGAGGGGVQVTAVGTIQLTGTGGILANGGDGQGNPASIRSGGGGGSGGQIVLSAAAIVAPASATASIVASGGNGGNSFAGSGNLPFSTGGGGGGGGGRITIQVATFNATSLTATLAVNGGTGGTGYPGFSGNAGGAGVIGITAGTSIVNNGEALTITAGKVGAAAFTSGNYNVAAGGQLSAFNTAQSVGTLAGAGNVNLSGSALTVGVGNASSIFAGTITSDSTLTKTGAGTFNVAGTQSYGRAVTIGAGTINVSAGGSVASGGALSNSGTINVSAGGAVVVTASGAVPAIGALSNSGTINVSAGGAVSTTGDLSNSGTLNVGANGSVTATGSLNNIAGGRVTLADASSSLSGSLFRNLAGATLSGTGTVNASLTNLGTVRVASGGNLIFNGTSNTNSGTIAVQGGIVEFTRSILNNSGGSFTGNGTIVTASAAAIPVIGLNNSGSLAFSGGPTDIYGLVQNSAGGSIISAGGGVLTLHNGLNFLAGSTIRTEAGSRTVVFGPTLLKGSFIGAGAVELGGTINIDPQIINFGGNLTLTSNTIFNMAVEGPGRGTGYDSLAVAGLATLAGTLNFNVGNGFVPTVGQQFLAVSYGSRSGVFGSINAFGLTPDQFLVADYRANGLYLTVASNAVPEPASLALLGLGVAGMIAVARRRR